LRSFSWFSRGYYRMQVQDGRIVVSDLRMGVTPGYAFRFAVAAYDGRNNGRRYAPEQMEGQWRERSDEDLDWLGDRLFGKPVVRAGRSRRHQPRNDRAHVRSC
jgi:inner membrane protein